MAEKRDYYEVLGVNKGATDTEIKNAFRKQAKTCHPDLHPGDKEAEARFKELNEAAEVLSDPEKRAKYDQFGHAAFDPSMGGQSAYGGGFGGFSDFSDIIDQMFGGGFSGGTRTRTGPVQGNDIRCNITISFEEAAFGVKKEITIPREESCATCSGTGAKPGTTPVRCTTCGGTGQVRTQQSTILGSFSSTRPCTACRGTGKVIKEPCADCRGTGRVRKNVRIAVNIPAGIDDGRTLIMRNEGEEGLRGGPRGDLNIAITVRPHKIFRREGYNLLLNLPISYTVAALGGDIIVPTLKGNMRSTIQPGTQSGTTLRLANQGIQKLNSTAHGDLYVTVTIDVPKRLTEEQRELLKKYAETINDVPQPKANKKNIFGKVKDAFNE